MRGDENIPVSHGGLYGLSFPSMTLVTETSGVKAMSPLNLHPPSVRIRGLTIDVENSIHRQQELCCQGSYPRHCRRLRSDRLRRVRRIQRLAHSITLKVTHRSLRSWVIVL
jgi:hypothetical protein